MTERFELLSQLGRGGMGTVWKARDVETGEVVALKLLHSMYVDDPEYVERFGREVEIARRIDSPHVVKVLGFGRRDGVPYVAMEFVDGPSLRDRLKTSGPVGWDEAKRIGTQLAEALAAAHGAGIVHRDIKPSNVLLDPDGQVKLADFGIARANDLTRMTGSVTVLGTPAYMPPDGEASEQSDLYGLGCVLYELLAGSPPFEGESQQQVLLKHIREAPNLERLPSSARKVVGRLLEKEPRRRPASADALLAVLTGSTNGSGAVRVPSRRNTGRWAARGLVAVATLGFTSVGGWMAWANLDSDPPVSQVPTPQPSATTDMPDVRTEFVPPSASSTPDPGDTLSPVASATSPLSATAQSPAPVTLSPSATASSTATQAPPASPFGAINGVVRWDNQPLSGVPIRLTSMSGTSEPRFTTSGSGGVYTFSDISPGDYYVATFPNSTDFCGSDLPNTNRGGIEWTAEAGVTFPLVMEVTRCLSVSSVHAPASSIFTRIRVDWSSPRSGLRGAVALLSDNGQPFFQRWDFDADQGTFELPVILQPGRSVVAVVLIGADGTHLYNGSLIITGLTP